MSDPTFSACQAREYMAIFAISAGALTPVESKEGLQFNLPNGNYNKAFTLLSTISPVVQRILED